MHKMKTSFSALEITQIHLEEYHKGNKALAKGQVNQDYSCRLENSPILVANYKKRAKTA